MRFVVRRMAPVGYPGVIFVQAVDGWADMLQSETRWNGLTIIHPFPPRIRVQVLALHAHKG
jgi:hypothetical protein